MKQKNMFIVYPLVHCKCRRPMLQPQRSFAFYNEHSTKRVPGPQGRRSTCTTIDVFACEERACAEARLVAVLLLLTAPLEQRSESPRE